MVIELIIISYNSKKHFDDLIPSIKKQSIYENIEITVVDNNSKDDTVEYLKKYFPEVNLIVSDENLGYGRAANLGAKNSKADIIFICNSDLILFENTIEKAVAALIKNKEIGVIGGQQEYYDGSWQYSYGHLPGWNRVLGNLYFYENIKAYFSRKNWNNSDYFKSKNVDYLDGAMLGIRREVFLETGGFDPDFYFYSEEADLCKRIAKNNLLIYYNPDIRFIHLRGGSSEDIQKNKRTAEMMVNAKQLYCKKHCSFIETKVYYLSEIYFSFFNLILSLLQKNKPKRIYHALLIKYFFKALFKL